MKSRKAAKRRQGVGESLAGGWASKASLGQGADFFKYHVAQHGGMAPYPGAVDSSVLPAEMAGPAMVAGINKALYDVRGLTDMPAPAVAQKVGGRRRKSMKAKRSAKRSMKAKKSAKRSMKRKAATRRRGQRGGQAPVNMNPMLLSKAEYGQAGLNPDYRGAATEYAMAAVRDRA
jgi:hypothetical protein